MKNLAPLIVLALVILGGLYYYFLYPPKVMEREANKALQQFAAAVATKDRVKIVEALQALMADQATIHLEVTYFSIGHPDMAPIVQNFDKMSFATYIDNILYTLTDYDARFEIEQFELAPDKKSAKVIFSSNTWGDGKSFYAGTSVDMRFSTAGTCESQVTFEEKQARLVKADCKIELGSVPKPGEEKKLENPEALKQLLLEHQ